MKRGESTMQIQGWKGKPMRSRACVRVYLLFASYKRYSRVEERWKVGCNQPFNENEDE